MTNTLAAKLNHTGACGRCKFCDEYKPGLHVCRHSPPRVTGAPVIVPGPQGAQVAFPTQTNWPVINPLTDWWRFVYFIAHRRQRVNAKALPPPGQSQRALQHG